MSNFVKTSLDLLKYIKFDTPYIFLKFYSLFISSVIQSSTHYALFLISQKIYNNLIILGPHSFLHVLYLL